MRPSRRPDLVFLLITVLGLLAFQYLRQTSQSVAAIPYSEFQTLLRDKQIAPKSRSSTASSRAGSGNPRTASRASP
jgi:hypothetical protein